MNIDNKLSDISFELFREENIHRVRIEVELINGVKVSTETIKPNRLDNQKSITSDKE
jgi:hypothetical protein